MNFSWSRFWRESDPIAAWFIYLGALLPLGSLVIDGRLPSGLGATFPILIGGLMLFISYRVKMHDDGECPTVFIHLWRASKIGLPAAVVTIALLFLEIS